jgi:predicted DNA-binding transcriptional regulator YafY
VRKLFLKALEKFPNIDKAEDYKNFLTTYTMSSWKKELTNLPEKYLEIQTALDRKLPLEIVYVNPGRPPQTRIVHPIALNSLGSQFYLTAFCEKASGERTFRLDRIISFRIL